MEYIQLIAVAAVFVAVVAITIRQTRPGRLPRTIILWLLGPIILMVGLFTLGLLIGLPGGYGVYEASFATMLVGIIVLVPWLVLCVIGFAIGFVLRGKRPQEPAPVPAATTPAAAAASPPKNLFNHSSPDGSIRVDIEPVEWANSQFVNTPRVVETATGRVLCDLLGSDWEANVAFPRERYVWLGLRRYRTPGYLFAEFDLAADRYRIALSSLDQPDEEGLLGDISDRLEHW